MILQNKFIYSKFPIIGPTAQSFLYENGQLGNWVVISDNVKNGFSISF